MPMQFSIRCHPTAHSIRLLYRHLCSTSVRCRQIERVLVANRGEIALRVMRTAKRMGIKTIAVYSEPDSCSEHAQFADESHHIGEASPLRSYLCAERILEVAKRARADAIHPGYGFLSENASFAEQCVANGVIFMGPPAQAIRDMGAKNTAKRIMIEANVPVVKGYNGDDQSEERLLAEATKIGFPIMMKAVCGGGGKGMRIAHSEAQFAENLASARSEAQKAFGNTDMILERYVQRPRHVEVQIFGDSSGNYVYLWERDCSIQRRHQKIIEEAPAPGLDLATRQRLGKAAVDAARAVGYVGAGTVEFIMDPADGQFYFMEMNTRLQVEHPVSEAITGLDLVQWQFQVAQGEPLPLAQDQIPLLGHAIEARIYAEDSAAGFMPTAGVLEHLEFPASSASFTVADLDGTSGAVRVDSGVREGDAVTVHYDPMIAKVIARGANRQEAIRRLDAALEQTHIGGLCNNVAFVRSCLAHPKFRQGDVYTDFIAEHMDELMVGAEEEATEESREETVLEAALGQLLLESALTRSAAPQTPFLGEPAFFRLNHAARRTIELERGGGDKGAKVDVTILRNGRYECSVGGGARHSALVDGVRLDATPRTGRPVLHFGVQLDGGKRHQCKAVLLEREIAIYGAAHHKWKYCAGSEDVGSGEALGGAGDANCRSPMPGVVEKLFVVAGDRVARGQSLVAVNAMKMEFLIRAPFDGTVASLHCVPGKYVPKDAVLVRLQADEAEERSREEGNGSVA